MTPEAFAAMLGMLEAMVEVAPAQLFIDSDVIDSTLSLTGTICRCLASAEPRERT